MEIDKLDIRLHEASLADIFDELERRSDVCGSFVLIIAEKRDGKSHLKVAFNEALTAVTMCDRVQEDLEYHVTTSVDPELEEKESWEIDGDEDDEE